MTKRYKHLSGAIAIMEMQNDGITTIYKCDGYEIPYKILEQGDDWELIEEEKDWQSILWDDLCKVFPKLTHSDGTIFDNYLEKHMPKITEEEIWKLDKIKDTQLIRIQDIIELLKSKGLYK